MDTKRRTLTLFSVVAAAALALSAANAQELNELPGPPDAGAPPDDPLAELRDPWAAVTGFRGNATVKIYGPEESAFSLAFGRVIPDRTRFEVSAPLIGTVAIVTAQGNDVLAYYPGDNVAVVGAGAVMDLSSLFGPGFGADFHGLVDGLAGIPSLYGTGGEDAAFEITTERGTDDSANVTWRSRVDGSRYQTISYRPKTGELINVRLYRDDEAAADATYGEWREIPPATAPGTVTIKTADTVTEIKITRFEFNVGIPDEAFSTTPPEGATIMEALADPAEFYEEP